MLLMISSYEKFKSTIIAKNNFKGLNNITNEFLACKNIELQKKMLILLLKHVKKNTLAKLKILNEFNNDLLQINSNKLKEGVNDLLYKINRQSEGKRGDLNTGIVCTKWESLDYNGVQLRTHQGYVFMDLNHLAFYSPKENYVISINSIQTIHKNELDFVLELKSCKKLLFRLTEENLNFINRIKQTLNFIEVTENKESPRNSQLKCDQLQRTSLNTEKLEFHSQIVSKIGKNLSIKIQPPKKDCFYETVIEEENKSNNERDSDEIETVTDRKEPILSHNKNKNIIKSTEQMKKIIQKIEKQKFKFLKNEFKNKAIKIKRSRKKLISLIEILNNKYCQLLKKIISLETCFMSL